MSNTVLKGFDSLSTHLCNQWNQIDLQVSFSMLEFYAMVTKGHEVAVLHTESTSVCWLTCHLLFRSTPLKHCGVFMLIMSNAVFLNAKQCCITNRHKDVSHGDVLFPFPGFALVNRQFCCYFNDEKHIVVCDKKGAHKAIVRGEPGLRI